ncbi:hypothetical protein C1646_765838 [Rhizophagus diaphanus]|nr:hypothetical protein C1646_765838 [Rhizophagus diaphanus] [Rhizophagus sp. MUCL 43196]
MHNNKILLLLIVLKLGKFYCSKSEGRNSFISKCSFIDSFKDYTSLELGLDIDIERSNVLGTKRNIEKLNISSHENNGKRIKSK